MQTRKVHEGQNIKRIREIFQIKQEVLADELGLSQQAMSSLEQKEALDQDMLEKVAKALRMTPEAIRNFNDETTVYNIQNNYEGSNLTNSPNQYNHQCTFNPFDKIVELYEALLKSEREKIALLEKMHSKI